MKVMIGSARIDERGKLSGGNAGDQKQISTPDYKGEVSQQDFYVHSKGWTILRAKKAKQAQKLAEAMITACNNKNIGYDQGNRLNILKFGTSSTTPTECDCSSLVRQCVIEATGKDPGNFTTVKEVSSLLYTKLFDRLSFQGADSLKEGDILVTKTKGHTVIVTQVDNGYPTLKRGSKGPWVKEMQTLLNYNGNGAKLEVDGVFGPLSEIAVIAFQKLHGLKGTGICDKATWNALNDKGF